MRYATKLEKILRESNISQSDLAREVGVDKSLMNKWVKGRHVPSAHFMTKVAKVLGMTEQEIFFDNTEGEYSDKGNTDL